MTIRHLKVTRRFPKSLVDASEPAALSTYVSRELLHEAADALVGVLPVTQAFDPETETYEYHVVVSVDIQQTKQ